MKRSIKRPVKLPTNMTSKYMKKCPICRAPYVNKCINCGYVNKDMESAKLFEKPHV